MLETFFSLSLIHTHTCTHMNTNTTITCMHAHVCVDVQMHLCTHMYMRFEIKKCQKQQLHMHIHIVAGNESRTKAEEEVKSTGKPTSPPLPTVANSHTLSFISSPSFTLPLCLFSVLLLSYGCFTLTLSLFISGFLFVFPSPSVCLSLSLLSLSLPSILLPSLLLFSLTPSYYCFTLSVFLPPFSLFLSSHTTYLYCEHFITHIHIHHTTFVDVAIVCFYCQCLCCSCGRCAIAINNNVFPACYFEKLKFIQICHSFYISFTKSDISLTSLRNFFFSSYLPACHGLYVFLHHVSQPLLPHTQMCVRVRASDSLS